MHANRRLRLALLRCCVQPFDSMKAGSISHQCLSHSPSPRLGGIINRPVPICHRNDGSSREPKALSGEKKLLTIDCNPKALLIIVPTLADKSCTQAPLLPLNQVSKTHSEQIPSHVPAGTRHRQACKVATSRDTSLQSEAERFVEALENTDEESGTDASHTEIARLQDKLSACQQQVNITPLHKLCPC